MRIMKCILICFIVVSLTLQGFLRSVFAAGSTEFSLKVKPLTMNEQVFLKTIEAKTHGLLNQSAGAYYDQKLENQIKLPRKDNPNSVSLGHAILGGAMIGAFFGVLASSGDAGSVKKSAWKGALFGVVTISILYYVF
ncbi:MAG: hypothetical protein PHX78_02800 [bacterium]|nr:hypothetical protein [bacterium]